MMLTCQQLSNYLYYILFGLVTFATKIFKLATKIILGITRKLRWRIFFNFEPCFLFAVLLFMSIFLSWIKQQDLSVIILFKKLLHSEPQRDL